MGFQIRNILSLDDLYRPPYYGVLDSNNKFRVSCKDNTTDL